ncbi:g11203 [Coccomyxa viridis]|uniref:G11203 protein n=1 Tax=Coccomyxa viridis TaxID=1274662 RepID=A0ABP1G7B8_9CHLO
MASPEKEEPAVHHALGKLCIRQDPPERDLELLDLPEGILQDIARLFTLADWVQGPARACRLLRRMKLTSIDLTCPIYKWKDSAGAGLKISYALACADRHMGPCTTSINLWTEAVQDGLISFPGRSQASLSPSILPKVVSLVLLLEDEGTAGMFQR